MDDIEEPVPLFVPPDELVSAPPAPLPIQQVPLEPRRCDLLVGIAAVDRSGRIREQTLVSALGWNAHDRLSAEVRHDRVILRRQPDGPFRIDSRRQAFLPGGHRALLGIGTGDRVLLVAIPERDELIIHPVGVLVDLVQAYYSSAEGTRDAH